MIQNLMWNSVLPLITGIIALVLGISVLRKNRQLAIAKGFLILMLMFTAAGISDFLMINASDPASALLFARGLVLFVVLIFAGFLYVSTNLAFIPLSKWLEKNRVLYTVFSLLIGLLIAYNLSSVDFNQFGYGLPASLASLIVLMVAAAFTAMTLALLVRRWRQSDDEQMRRECFLLSLAVLMPYLWGLVLFILDLYDIKVPSELSPGFFASIVMMAFSVYRQRLFTVMPVSEDLTSMIGAREEEVLAPGSYLLFEETRADGMYETLLSQISNGVEGLIVTRTYPDDLRERHGLKRTPVIWLSSHPGQDWIDPTNLSILEHTITEFLKVGHNTVVAIDGIEYLISNNGSPKVLRLLYGLRDEILMNQSRMIVTLNPKILDEKELAFFERDFEVVRR
ncbi:MAG TPA: DUF835 domain-containing protein [Methanomassiliicoccales archaeon]|jgi:NADH:ubiquinone oxidoreductase subunit K